MKKKGNTHMHGLRKGPLIAEARSKRSPILPSGHENVLATASAKDIGHDHRFVQDYRLNNVFMFLF